MKHTVMMTFPSWKWEEYGKYCLPTADEFWPEEMDVIAIVEKPEDIPVQVSERVKIIDFDEAVGERLKAFEERNKDKDIFDLGTKGNIGVQAAKFARKAYAQLHVLEQTTEGYVWFIDGDVKILQPITVEMLDKLTSTDADIGCLPRWWKPQGYTETGFIFWNTEKPNFGEWCRRYAECYDHDRIFEYDAWHDCIAFDHATKSMLKEGLIEIVDLGYGVKSNHPLVSGPLGKYFDHMKGGRKFVGESKERVRVHGR